MGNAERAKKIIFPESGCDLGHVTRISWAHSVLFRNNR